MGAGGMRTHAIASARSCAASPHALAERVLVALITAAVGDLTSGELPEELAGCRGRADLATLMFVLSAISPEKMDAAAAAVATGLREGGLLLLR